MTNTSKRRCWEALDFPPKKMKKHDLEDETISINAVHVTQESPLLALPTELLQHIFLHLLTSCLYELDTGERSFLSAVLSLSLASKRSRSNLIAVLRMLRNQLINNAKDSLVNQCARPHEMRILVLTLDYNLTTGSRIVVKIERYRAPGSAWAAEEERRQKEKERLEAQRLRELRANANAEQRPQQRVYRVVERDDGILAFDSGEEDGEG